MTPHRLGAAGTAAAVWAVLAVLATSAGCAGTLTDPDRFLPASTDDDGGGSGAACPDITSTVFANICAASGCHSTADQADGLDLQSPDVASRLVGVCVSSGGMLIDPSDPAASVLYLKLTPSPPFGARMPFGGTPLDPATLACVLQWIEAQSGDAGSCDGGESTSGDSGTEPPPADSGSDSTTNSEAGSNSADSGAGSMDSGTEKMSVDSGGGSMSHDSGSTAHDSGSGSSMSSDSGTGSTSADSGTGSTPDAAGGMGTSDAGSED